MRHAALTGILTLLAVVGLDIAGGILRAAMGKLPAAAPKVLLVALAFYAGVLLVWRIRARLRRG